MGRAVGAFRQMKRKFEAGFSLLEVVAVLAMTGVIAAALVNSYIQASYTQNQLTGRATALILGEGKLAEILSGIEQANSGDWPDKDSNRKYHWRVQRETSDNELILVTLIVEWRGRDGSLRSKTFEGSCFPE
jgi:prepilin-type N-terminal cleavage/methylation domain-containing protein